MDLSYEPITVHTRHPFLIARGGTDTWQTVWVRLRDGDGVEGWGEAAPSRFYGESADSVVAALERWRPLLAAADDQPLEAVEAALDADLRWNASAKAAVSAALHDREGKRLGVPVWRLWGLDPARTPRSSFTIGLAPDDDTLRQRVLEAAPYPILKVKLGTPRDVDIVRVVRAAAPEKVIRVDANCAWTPKGTLRMVEELLDLGVEFVEQPLPPHDLDGLRFVRERSPLPIVADESCLIAADVPRLAGCVDGVNLKLAKCGSLREAVRIVHAARAHGMRVMCGCMVESSLGITAAAHLAPLLDDADLDGAALLRDDPFVGATIAGGAVTLPTAPGLGVTRR